MSGHGILAPTLENIPIVWKYTISQFDARVVANFGAAAAVQDDNGTVHRVVPLKKLSLLVAGDKVRCEHGQGSGSGNIRVIELLQRSSVLARPDRRGQMKPLAANLTQLLIIIAAEPTPESLLIDQFCVAARLNGIQPVIVLNKTDRIKNEDEAAFDDLLQPYTTAGFRTLRCSTKTDDGLDELSAAIQGEISVLVGQSGVGKSSIAHRILPERDIRIGEISAATGVGAHTTTVSFWYDIGHGGALIDSPGVRQFAVDYLKSTEVEAGYPEIVDLSQHCRFANCVHVVEPDCAVRASLQDNTLSAMRYNNYVKLSQKDA